MSADACASSEVNGKPIIRTILNNRGYRGRVNQLQRSTRVIPTYNDFALTLIFLRGVQLSAGPGLFFPK